MTRLRPGAEDGIALVMAVLVLAVLTVTTVSVISFTSATSRDASLSKAGQQAYSLAEAGFNNALAQIASHYPGGSVYDASWDTDGTPDGVLTGSASYAGGTTTWSASFAGDGTGYRGTWTITATGSVANPTGPDAANRTRTITAKMDAWEQPASAGSPGMWQIVYSGGTACTTIDNTVAFTAPLYTPGDLCLTNQGKILEPTELVAVGGSVTIGTQGSIGTSAQRIDEVYIAGSCKYKNNPASGPPCNVNSSDTEVWAGTFSTTLPSNPFVPADFAEAYDRAAPGPRAGCATSSGTPPTFDTGDGLMNRSVPGTFNLTPGSSYTCVATSGGELSWDASAKVLTVNGIVFIDGSVTVDTGNTVTARYSGNGVVYVSGTVLIQNNSTLCAVVDGSTCDWDDWEPGVDGDDPMLVFAADGVGTGTMAGDSIQVSQSKFQGGLYGTYDIDIRNSSTVQGPMIGVTVIDPDNSSAQDFPSVIQVSVGTPGDTTPPVFQIGPPYDVSY